MISEYERALGVVIPIDGLVLRVQNVTLRWGGVGWMGLALLLTACGGAPDASVTKPVETVTQDAGQAQDAVVSEDAAQTADAGQDAAEANVDAGNDTGADPGADTGVDASIDLHVSCKTINPGTAYGCDGQYGIDEVAWEINKSDGGILDCYCYQSAEHTGSYCLQRGALNTIPVQSCPVGAACTVFINGSPHAGNCQ